MRTNGYIQRLVVADGYEDERGDYHEGETRLDDVKIECLANISSQPTTRTFDDGVSRVYQFTVFTAPNEREFEVGEHVRLTRLGKTYDLDVVGFAPYNLQNQIWLGWESE